jgi:replicative DNA helicase
MSSNPTAEMALLGALLTDPTRLGEVSFIRASHFFLPVHADIFEAIGRTVDHRGKLDLVLLLEQLGEAQDQLRVVGGPQYLRQLVDGCPSSATAPHYAEIVFEHAARRHLAVVCQTLLYESKSDLDGAMDRALREIGATRAALKRSKEPAAPARRTA